MNISIAYSKREYLPDKKTKPLLTKPLFLINFHDPPHCPNLKTRTPLLNFPKGEGRGNYVVA